MIRKQQEIMGIMLEKGSMSSSAIHAEMARVGTEVSLVTVKRMLSEMVKLGALAVTGSGRAVRYQVTIQGRILTDIDAKKYCAVEPDKRYGASGYNFDLFDGLSDDIFDEEELKRLDDSTKEYNDRAADVSATLQKKELERLVVELAWKSSRIEGNTYTLLDTEKLILENKEAPGHGKDEARMILNHKNAFYFIWEHSAKFKTFDLSNLEQLHAIIVKDSGVNLGLRKGLVGVTGSKYRPLDNAYQIREAVAALLRAVAKMKTPYAKALLALAGISYVQPFEDGNKRTSRLTADALLLAHGCAPLSYRSVDENEYREAMLVFYELNSIVPIKKIFIAQYEFAAKNYAVRIEN